MKVLYIHSAGPFGGASRSLYEMLLPLVKAGDIEPYFLAKNGTAVDFFSKVGPVVAVPGISQFDHTDYGYYRGWRWLILLREFCYFPAMVYGLIKSRVKYGDFDVVHVNDVVGVFPLLASKIIFTGKTVMHVRCLMRHGDGGVRTRLLNYFLKSVPDQVVCIDETVKRSLNAELNSRVVHNGLNVLSEGGGGEEYIPNDVLKVGFVGNLLVSKGIVDLVESARILRDRGIFPEFHIYGDNARLDSGLKARVLKLIGLYNNVGDEVRRLVDVYDLREQFHFHGFVDRLDDAYLNMDVVCFPSHLNAPGRPVLEAACFGRPSIVAVEEPTEDTIIENVTGLIFRPRDVSALADKIEWAAVNTERLREMGVAAKKLALANYTQVNNSLKILNIYNNLTKG